MTSTVPAPGIPPAAAREVAAELAARILIPTRLPVRYDGQRLRHLSNAALSKLASCPEQFRRRYILGIKTPTAAIVFLGRRVDDTLTAYCRHLLGTGERLELGELKDRYEKSWHEAVEQEQADSGLDFAELDEPTARALGLEAIDAAHRRLLPHLAQPVGVQRRIEFKLAAALEWSIVGYPDVETQRVGPGWDQPVATILDWKVKGDPIRQEKADRDTQPGVYLAGRWLAGDPAAEFLFAQMLRPGPRRAKVTTSVTRTTRTVGELRAVLARVALAASQLEALYERFGPERPWGFADPTGWQCSERYCPHWRECPGGAGL
jgi:hypothetical protein